MTLPLFTEQGRIFTPNITSGTFTGESMDDGRAIMRLNEEDAQAWAALGDRGSVVVTDQTTGTRWNARRANCGAGCRCAAAVTPVAVA